MSDPSCSQLWQIEAARDGRLSGASLDLLARHVRDCAVCRAEAAYVEGLAAQLRALPDPSEDAIAQRRVRQEVLSRVDAEFTGRIPRSKRVIAWRAGLVAAGALMIAVGVGGWKRAHGISSRELAKTTVDAVEEGGAHWSRASEGEVEHIDLQDGTLRLKVHRKPGGKRVVVRVPDGEIEDEGTIFHVVVAHGHTQRVGVDEGRVTIRLSNASVITLSSGQVWERSVDVPAQATVVASTSALPHLPETHGSAEARVPAPHVSTPHPHIAPVASVPVPPADADEEDAAYLRSVRLLREGRENDARAAARGYLRRFPNGFRRDEMERMVR